MPVPTGVKDHPGMPALIADFHPASQIRGSTRFDGPHHLLLMLTQKGMIFSEGRSVGSKYFIDRCHRNNPVG